MAIQKKHGKGRLDRYYRLAKEKGYRARAAFKLLQINQKYHVLEKSKVVLDLCAAPGSWSQVASEIMPPQSLIVAVDLAPIKPIPRCISFQSDITTEKCRATIRQHLKTLKADIVLHDGAPNVGTAWVQDAFTQAELVLQSLRLAVEFLAPGGTFITKIFRSKDYNSLLWVFNQLFTKVEATKPPSSRNVSAEIFVVCREYKAPKKIDPRFLDAKAVFAELTAPTPNNEAKVFNPEVKKRKREGYEDGDYTQFKEVPVSEFIQTIDPIAMLGSNNRLSFDQRPNGDIALAALERMPETTKEIRDCCADLKLLGRKDFKLLLRWRLKVRDKFGFSTKKKQEVMAGEEVAKVEPMDEEMQIQEELQRLKDQTDSKKKKEKRKDNERKRKEIVRMQMNMTTPMEIGMDQAGPYGEDSMFALKTVDKVGGFGKLADGKMHTVTLKEDKPELSEEDESEDEEGDSLEGQLDEMYEEYQEKKKATDAKYRAKKARKEHVDEDFEDFSDRDEPSSEDEVVENDDSDDSDVDGDEEQEDKHRQPIFLKPNKNVQSKNGLSHRATMFFDQDVFKGIDGLDACLHSDSGIDMEDSSEQETEKGAPSSQTTVTSTRPTKLPGLSSATAKRNSKSIVATNMEDSDGSEGGFELVPQKTPDMWESAEQPEPTTKDGRPDIDVITAEAMTLAHALASGSTTRASLLDDGFNKYSHRDTDGLPSWFLDDEDQHSRPQRPVTAAAAAAIKEKLRALNARPIKKVREAKARKKMRAAQQMEKLKKKSALMIEEDGVSEKDKAKNIEKMMAKAGKKKPRAKVTVVVARGGNRGISGRPKGTKGKYKMVDGRMKKDVRGMKRAEKRNKKSR